MLAHHRGRVESLSVQDVRNGQDLHPGIVNTQNVQRTCFAHEPILQAWQADPERVRQLCGWAWIRKAPTKLPADTQVIQA